MRWLTAIIIKLGRWIVPSLLCAYFTTERGEQHRESDRIRWWNFKVGTEATKSKVDDAVAEYLRARFNFHDSPDVKAHQALLDKINMSQFTREKS